MKEDALLVRPELNFEKWPGIWQPTKSNNKLYEIVLERKTTDSISKVEITANSKYGPLTTETQKIIYALYKISEEKGHPRRIPFSCSKIAKILNKKWGKGTTKTIKEGLYQLRFTAFILKDVFFDSISKKRIKSFVDTFTILSVLKLSEEEDDGHITTEACYCEFNEYIYNNLLNNYVKPTLLNVVLGFGDDGIAQLLYSHIDLMLAKSDEYRRPTKEIFCSELNHLGKEYIHVSRRKRTIDRILPKLDGKMLSSGGVLEVRLDKLLKNGDYDLVARKIEQQHQTPATNKNEKKQIAQLNKKKIKKILSSMPEDPETKKTSLKEQTFENFNKENAREIVELFAKKFFNLENVRATTKELNQAKQLIKEFGFEASKYIVGYVYSQANRTNYKIGQFGAILEYAGRGAAQYEKEIKAKQYQQKLENCQFCKGTVYIDVITNETEKVRYKLKCPHSLEQLEIIAKEKKIKLRLATGQIIENF